MENSQAACLQGLQKHIIPAEPLLFSVIKHFFHAQIVKAQMFISLLRMFQIMVFASVAVVEY